MKFNEIFSEFEAGKSIRRKSWPLNRRISNKENLSLCNFDYSADDWEIWEESPYDEFLEEMKHYNYPESRMAYMLGMDLEFLKENKYL